MANLQKKYRTRVFISRKLTHMLLCVLIFTCGLMSIIYSRLLKNAPKLGKENCCKYLHISLKMSSFTSNNTL